MSNRIIKTVGMSSVYGTSEPVPVYVTPQDSLILNPSSTFMAGDTGGVSNQNPFQCAWSASKLIFSVTSVAELVAFLYYLKKYNTSPFLDKTEEAEALKFNSAVIGGWYLLMPLWWLMVDGTNLLQSFINYNYDTFTPTGWAKNVKEAWENCGGSGLNRKVKTKVADLVPKTKPTTPSQFAPTNLSSIKPEVLAGATGLTLGALILSKFSPSLTMASFFLAVPLQEVSGEKDSF